MFNWREDVWSGKEFSFSHIHANDILLVVLTVRKLYDLREHRNL